VWIQEHLGAHHRTGMYYVFGALRWRRRGGSYRAARFSLVFMAVTWLLMALTRGA
jgi:hypothetical protein